MLHNLNIERAVLSSIFFEPSSFDDISAVLTHNDFFLAAHQAIFRAMNTLAANKAPIDEEFMRKQLAIDKRLDDEVLLDIFATNPLSNTSAYAAEIKELANKRGLVELTTEIKKVIFDEQLGAIESLDRVQQRLFDMGTKASSNQFREAEEIVRSTLARIEANKARGNKLVIGLDTGFHELNKKTSGFNDGDMIVIAARPSMGKTAFALNLAANVLNNTNNGVAIFSLEMPAEDLMLRMLSSKTSVPMQRIKLGDMSDDEWSRVAGAADFYSKSKLFVEDGGMLTIPRLRSELRRLKMQNEEIKLAIIDYLQLMTGTNNKERHQEISDISRGLKMLARELKIPIIALSQLNRGLESRDDKEPKLADIRESGSIEQDADIVMFVHREDVYTAKEEKEKKKKAEKEGKTYQSDFKEKAEENAEIIIAKNRNGETGKVKLIFQKAFTRFIDTERADRGVVTHQYHDTVVNVIEMPKI